MDGKRKLLLAEDPDDEGELLDGNGWTIENFVCEVAVFLCLVLGLLTTTVRSSSSRTFPLTAKNSGS